MKNLAPLLKIGQLLPILLGSIVSPDQCCALVDTIFRLSTIKVEKMIFRLSIMRESKLIFPEIHKISKILTNFRNIQWHLVVIRAEIQHFFLLACRCLKLWFNFTWMFQKSTTSMDFIWSVLNNCTHKCRVTKSKIDFELREYTLSDISEIAKWKNGR